MKIGILTQPLLWNYGGILQNYALQTVLIRMGHNAITINRKPIYKKPTFISVIKSNLKGMLLRKNASANWNSFLSEDQVNIIAENTFDFIRNNIAMTQEVHSNELATVDSDYNFDAYVVGSDQVWVPSYALESFLDFVPRENVIKVAYAASCGNISWMDYEEIARRCICLADSFSGISVREDSLLQKANKYLNNRVELVLDPTLLLEPQDYYGLCDGSRRIFQPYIFSYILDEDKNKLEYLKNLENHFGIPIVKGTPEVDYRKANKRNIQKAIFAPVSDWIDRIANASFVITDSFHGTAFSILFNKQFQVIGNKGRGIDRQKSILNMFNLSERLVSLDTNNHQIANLKEIDFTDVNQLLTSHRNLSIDFLKTSLNEK